MKKNALKLICLILSLNSFGQDEINKGFTSIGVFLSPSYSYFNYTMHDTFHLNTHPQLDAEIAKVGYQYGVNGFYTVNKKLDIFSSLSVTNHGSQTGQVFTSHAAPLPGSNPNQQPSSGTVYAYDIVYSKYYLDFSLGARYNFLKGKTKLYISPHIEANYFLSADRTIFTYHFNADTEVNTYDEAEIADFYTLRYSVGLSVGSQFKLGQRMNGITELRYRQMMNKVADEASQIYPYSFGLNLGITYNL